MKRKIVALSVFIVFFFNYAFSQDTPSSKSFRLGLKVAPTMSWIKPNTKDVSKTGSKFGLAYGLMGDFYFTDNYGLSTGIDVSYGGGKMDDKRFVNNTPGYTESMTYNLQFIEIPVTLKMRTKEYGYLTYFAQFGFGGSFNIKAKQGYDITGTPPTGRLQKDTDLDVTGDKINMFRASFIVGFGAEYSLTGSTRFIIGVGFNNGLTDILKEKGLKGTNNFLSLNAGILF
jgi:hypothetical protein